MESEQIASWMPAFQFFFENCKCFQNSVEIEQFFTEFCFGKILKMLQFVTDSLWNYSIIRVKTRFRISHISASFRFHSKFIFQAAGFSKKMMECNCSMT